MFGKTSYFFLIAFLSTTWAYPQDFTSDYNAIDVYSGRDARDYDDESTFSDDFEDDTRNTRQRLGMPSGNCMLEPLLAGKDHEQFKILKKMAGEKYSEKNDALEFPEVVNEAFELRKNVITGLGAVMDASKVTLTGQTLNFDVKIPKFEIMSQYKLNVTGMSGRGKMSIGFRNVDEQAIIKLKVDRNTGKVSVFNIKEKMNKEAEIFFSMENLVYKGKTVDWPWINQQVNQDLRTISKTWLMKSLLKLIETNLYNEMLVGCHWDTLKKYQKT